MTDNFAIVVDNGMDFFMDIVPQIGAVIPYVLHFGGVEYMYDAMDKELYEEIYAQIDAHKDTVRTAAPDPVSVEAVFKKLLLQGQDVIYIGVSHNISSVSLAVNIAKMQLGSEYATRRIAMVNSKTTATGLALLAKKAIECRNASMTFEETLKDVEELRSRLCTMAILGDAELALRYGRLTNRDEMKGAMLGMEFILQIEQDGRLKIRESVRGKNKATKRLSEIISESISPNTTLGLSYGTDEPTELMELLKEEGIAFKVGRITPSVAVAVGTSACIVSFERKMV